MTWGRTTRAVARRIDREARRRRLAPGARLADEPTMIEQFQTSRGTLRQAIQLLGFLGRVEPKFGPGGGTVIARPDASVVSSALAMVLQSQGATSGDVLAALAALQPMAASLAATAAKDGELEALRAAADELGLAASHRAFAEASRAFERQIADASGNPAISVLATALIEMARLPVVDEPEWSRRRFADEARDLVGHVRAGNASLAATAHAASWARRLTNIERHAPRLAAAPVVWADVDEQLEGGR